MPRSNDEDSPESSEGESPRQRNLRFIRRLRDVLENLFRGRQRERVPRNTSILQGQDWVAEIMNGSDSRFFDNFRMRKPVFLGLVQMLLDRGVLKQSDHDRVSPTEAVALFVRTVAMHTRMLSSGERFQHSTETIHRQFHRVKKALFKLSPELIRPSNMEEVHHRILSNPDFYPYFEVSNSPNFKYSISFLQIYNSFHSFVLQHIYLYFNFFL